MNIGYLIKNNIKLMLRNKWIIVVMILGPVFVIAILSSAFEDLMKSYEKVDSFYVGYSVEQQSVFADYMDQIKVAGEESGMIFTEYPEGDPEELMRKNELAGFVEFGQDRYVLYQSADYKIEGITLEYFISRIVGQAAGNILQAGTAPEMDLPVEELEYMPAVDSKDYYGIVYIVYFIWCGIVCISGVLSSEKKNGISKKFQVSPISGTNLFLSKWIPCVGVIAGGMAVAILVCVWMFGIKWGNILWSILILLLSVMAATAFELFIYYIFNNLAVTIVAVFTVVWVMGFVGGSFETYMFSSIPEGIKKLSPIYYIDRVLVEYSCMGESSYTGSCILFMLAIIIICAAGALFVDKMRKGGRA